MLSRLASAAFASSLALGSVGHATTAQSVAVAADLIAPVAAAAGVTLDRTSIDLTPVNYASQLGMAYGAFVNREPNEPFPAPQMMTVSFSGTAQNGQRTAGSIYLYIERCDSECIARVVQATSVRPAGRALSTAFDPNSRQMKVYVLVNGYGELFGRPEARTAPLNLSLRPLP